jgi:uncharacterized phage protein (TIGR02216 family)
MTPRELAALLKGATGAAPGSLNRAALAGLMARFPD